MKHIIFSFSLVLISCNTQKSDVLKQTACIDTILKQDDSLGRIRNDASKEHSLSNTILSYTDALNALDYSNCPESFSSAFKGHIDAWNNMMLITNKYPTLRGEMHDVFDSIKTTKDSVAFKIFLKDIWDTWDTIEKVKSLN
ncbi:hypothetical protein [Olleya sp. YS]|uniref:hypothetical protein n=1 Tax=Olleya sp. YS TaxID=3028318 RepID=UPI0024340CCA|nr:hypothetical protein [Olleya sp. YS]WGD35174.1 hypothetical protein Ollyesu_01875 [Olleya sp. YS]